MGHEHHTLHHQNHPPKLWGSIERTTRYINSRQSIRRTKDRWKIFQQVIFKQTWQPIKIIMIEFQTSCANSLKNPWLVLSKCDIFRQTINTLSHEDLCSTLVEVRNWFFELSCVLAMKKSPYCILIAPRCVAKVAWRPSGSFISCHK